jgi:hypothetical protein
MPDTLVHTSLNLMILTFPVIPQGAVAGKPPIPLHHQPMLPDRHEEPGVLFINYGSHIMAVCNDEPPQTDFEIGVKNSHATKQEYLFRIEIPKPIPPGSKSSFHLSLRFGLADATSETLASDVYKKFTNAFKYQVNWKDRRVIGDAFLSGRAVKQAFVKNPRAWFNNNSKVDITTESGKEDFRNQLLKYAEDCITNLKQLDAQGVIFWDIEGQEIPSIIYVGDPAMLPELAPEMEWKGTHNESTIDAFFNKFKKNSLRRGLCIRPTKIKLTDKGYVQEHTEDPAQTLIDKISYAKKRWGCTLFYIDSNTNRNKSRFVLLDALLFKRIHKAHPDVLLIPEGQNAKYYAYTAPYDELRRGYIATPKQIREIYPKAFSVINIDGADLVNRPSLVEAVKNGDILMCHVWYNSKSTIETQRIISEINRSHLIRKKQVKQ